MNPILEKYSLRKAGKNDIDAIWDILRQAIKKRKSEGSEQWQDGYPNPTVVASDIEKNYGLVCVDENDNVIAYIALIFDIEPAYEHLEGQWLSENQPYAGIHRLAVSQEKKVKGLATWMMQKIEKICIDNNIHSIKADTNFDNEGMLRVFEKLGYTYCGEVYFRGSARKAFEKLID